MKKRKTSRKRDTGIAYQNKDVASKVTGEALEGKSLAVFGLPSIKIVKALPTNLPAVESTELRLDNLFLLDDGAVGIIDYESDYSEENFVKYLNYAARVVRRYAGKHRMKELKSLKIIVIYTADVESARQEYDLGGVRVRVETAYLVGQDTEGIYRRLAEKLTSGQGISDEEQLQLMLLPLTVKGKEKKQEMIVKAVELARRMDDRRQTVETLAGILTFTDKVIDGEYRQRIKEEIEMTQVGKMIFDDGVKAGKEIGTEIGVKLGISQGKDGKLIDLVYKKLKKGKTEDEMAEALEERVEVIREICQAIALCGEPYDSRKALSLWKRDRS